MLADLYHVRTAFPDDEWPCQLHARWLLDDRQHSEAFAPDRGSPRAWLCTVAHNLVVDDARSRASRPSETELTEFKERPEDGVHQPGPHEDRVGDEQDARGRLGFGNVAKVLKVARRERHFHARAGDANWSRALGNVHLLHGRVGIAHALQIGGRCPPHAKSFDIHAISIWNERWRYKCWNRFPS